MLLHVKHASTRHDHIVINTPDTDMFLIILSKCSDIESHLYFMTGTEKHRIIDIDAVATSVNKRLKKTECEKVMFLDALQGKTLQVHLVVEGN